MPVRDEYLDLRGLRFHYRDWGGSGAPVVLLHGLASNARIWDLTAPLLARRFRVLALDQRGHGLSAKPVLSAVEGPVLSAVEGPDDGYDFPSISGDLAAFIEALGLERPGLVGHSWGGNVALQFAADYPEAVAWLALVDGGFLDISAFEGMTWERVQQVMAPPPLDGVKLSAFLQGARSWPDLKEVWSDEVQAIVLANFRIDEDETIHPHLTHENHLKILRSLWEQKPSELWAGLRCPVLLVPAARQSADPRSAVWLEAKRKAIAAAQERLPGVRVVWMEDTIHDVPLQRPAALAGAIAGFAAGVRP